MPSPRRITTTNFSTNDWNFTSTSGPIDGIPRLVALSRRLADPYSSGEAQLRPFCVHGATRSLKPCLCGSALVMGINMHMPEAVFGQNLLRIENAKTGTTVLFDVEDALKIWAQGSVEKGSRSLLCPPAQLESWRQKMAQAKMKSSVDVDWTFDCNGYVGKDGRNITTTNSNVNGNGNGSSCGNNQCASAQLMVVKSTTSIAAFGSSPATSINTKTTTENNQNNVQSTSSFSSSSSSNLVWQNHTGDGIDMELLKRREPILYSATIPLFFDGLHDHGESEMTVRIRVMKSCFFVLLRHQLRVDQMLIQFRKFFNTFILNF